MDKKHRAVWDTKGSVLMEFILVAPIYFVLLGGLVTVGELLLLNNRIAVADRNIGYIGDYLQKSVFEQRGKILKVLVNLGGENVAEYAEATLGYAKKTPVPSIMKVRNTEDFTTETRWGCTYATALTVKGVELPSFINGMIAMISVISGDKVSNEDFVYSLGALQSDQLGRHYVIGRKSDVAYRDANSEEYEEPKAKNMLDIALKLSMENVLGNPVINSGADNGNSNATQNNYDRVFGDLFSSAN